MGQHEFSIARRMLLGAPLAAFAVALAAASCGHLNSETPDAGSGTGDNSSGSSSGSPASSGGSGSGSNPSSSGNGGGSNGGPTGSSSGSGSGAPSSSGASSGARPPDMIIDGGAPDVAVVKMACGDSTEKLPYTPGIGVDISRARGYTDDVSVQTNATAAVNMMMSNSQLASQMRGTPPQSGGMNQFNDIYRTIDDMQVGIKGFEFRDGPRGVNLVAPQFTGTAQAPNPIQYGNGYSTAMPVNVSRGASWDLDLEFKIAGDVGDEMLASGNTMILAPCVNILRHPAWGRSQETYGEDSFLLGRFGSAYTAGVQQYIPGCVKHFAGNNIENGRSSQNAVMDDQTLHEIYGRHFEMIVQEGGIACVMASYNELNGTKNTINPTLLINMLRDTFGFKGFILSDFWAMPPGQVIQTTAQQSMVATQGLSASLDMELPWSLNYSQLESAATKQQLVDSATRIIEQKMRFNIDKTGVATSTLGLNALPGHTIPLTTTLGANGITGNDGHISDSEKLGQEGMVLLKNANNTLPIKRASVKTIAVIGAQVAWNLSGTKQTGTVNFATDVRIGDLGSSRVGPDPSKTIGMAAGITQAAGTGITVMSGNSATLADSADFVVLVAGMTPEDEGEEYTGAGDRTTGGGTTMNGTPTSSAPSFNLDVKSGSGVQNALIAAVAAKNKPMVVVLEGGSAINMPWLASVPAVVMAWYPGQHGGAALGRLLFGDANFTGKLPITWPVSETDEPPFNQGGGNGGTTMMDYYLGYRYFDQNKKTPLFAFGSGLSYTTFKYETIGVPCSTVTSKSVVDVSVAVTNTGTVPGDEVSFLFVSYPNTKVRRSVKELKGFHRTTSPIMPGQTVVFTIPLRVQDLKYWNSTATATTPVGWAWENGPVQIMVGPSSDNLPLTDSITLQQ
jgi:beta-glucosidase